MSSPSITYTAWEIRGLVEPSGTLPAFYQLVVVKHALDARSALDQADQMLTRLLKSPTKINVVSMKRYGWRGASPRFTR